MTQPNTIQVTVKLFAAYQDALGQSEITLSLPPNTSVASLCDRLIAEHPELAPWREVTRFGINFQFADPHTIIQSGDEIVLIPPVSGG